MDLKIEAYSEKSIVVFGNTKDYKEQLKEFGGKWNSNLNKNGEKFGGWIYPNIKKTELENWIQTLKSGNKIPNKPSASAVIKTTTPVAMDFSSLTEQRLIKIEDKLDKIINLLQDVAKCTEEIVDADATTKPIKTKSLVDCLHKFIEKLTMVDSDSDEEEIPMKRLLRK